MLSNLFGKFKVDQVLLKKNKKQSPKYVQNLQKVEFHFFITYKHL